MTSAEHSNNALVNQSAEAYLVLTVLSVFTLGCGIQSIAFIPHPPMKTCGGYLSRSVALIRRSLQHTALRKVAVHQHLKECCSTASLTPNKVESVVYTAWQVNTAFNEMAMFVHTASHGVLHSVMIGRNVHDATHNARS